MTAKTRREAARMSEKSKDKYALMILSLLHTIEQKVWEKEHHPLRRAGDKG